MFGSAARGLAGGGRACIGGNARWKIANACAGQSHSRKAGACRPTAPFFAGPRCWSRCAPDSAVEEPALRAQLQDVDLIVNATPLGMNPSDAIPVPTRLLAPHHMVFDAVYGPSKTALIRAADEAGARGANGLSMLLHQGALSFSIWFDRDAPIDVMRAVLPLCCV